jgi:activator of HSP90 ATPase
MPKIQNKKTTRRYILAGGVLGFGSLAMSGAPAGAQEIRAVKAIHQEEDFAASPQRIYDALLDSRKFTAFAGGRVAEIHREVGGVFSVFDGHIIGRTLELLPNRRIVQAWRVVPWPEGIYSIARFELQEQGTGTRLIFDHTGFPPSLAESLAEGWQENYWKALRKYLS